MNKKIDNHNKVLMIGSDLSVKGGMTSVILLYQNAGLFDENIEYLASHVDGGVFRRLFFYINFIRIFILKLITDKHVKVIHAHSSFKGSFYRKALVIWIASLFKKKSIFHLHGSDFNIFYDQSPLIIQRLISMTLDKASLIIVLARQWKKDIEKICINPNIVILHNPVVIKEPVPPRQQAVLSVLFMGLIGKRKGAYDLVEAATFLGDVQAQINLYGNGETEKLKQYAIEKHVEQCVQVNGWIAGDDVDKAYRQANVYVLPSYNEGLPMSILEAMSYGLPVISTTIGGIPDAVENGVNGYLIEPGDARALAEKIGALANDPALRKKMGENSYNTAREKFDITVIIAQLKQIYTNLFMSYKEKNKCAV